MPVVFETATFGGHDDELSSQFVGPAIGDGTDWISALGTGTAKRKPHHARFLVIRKSQIRNGKGCRSHLPQLPRNSFCRWPLYRLAHLQKRIWRCYKRSWGEALLPL